MKVDELWRYPVKSMIGQRVDEVEIDDLGIVGDRTWATRDLERGGIRGAKKIGGLMRCAAADRGDGHAVITLPDATTVATDDEDCDERVSAALGHRVSLQALRPADDLEHYRRGAPDSDDAMAEIRGLFGREPDEPLPDFTVFPPEIMEFESLPGTYYDAFPLLILTTSSLRSLAEAVPEAAVDVRRFRPSLVIDTGDAPGYPEFAWTGQRLSLGDVELEVGARCPRCVMVTEEIDETTPADRSVLRHIVRELGQDFGVYATVRRPGRVRVADEVRLDA